MFERRSVQNAGSAADDRDRRSAKDRLDTIRRQIDFRHNI